MTRYGAFLLVLMLAAVGVPIGALVGAGWSIARYAPGDVVEPPTWVQVPTPAGTVAARLEPVDVPFLCVVARGGTRRCLELPFQIQPDAPRWEDTATVDDLAESYTQGRCTRLTDPPIAVPPRLSASGSVVEVVECDTWPHHDSQITESFAILADGTLWRVHEESITSVGMFAGPLEALGAGVRGARTGAVIGGLIGAVVGVAAHVVSRRRRPGGVGAPVEHD